MEGVQTLVVEYLPVVIFLAIAIVLSCLFLVASTLLAPRNPDPEKVSAYECGFNAFDDARMKFDVRFYLVSILFIIFDLEVAFLFPWAVAFKRHLDAGVLVDDGVPGRSDDRLCYEWKKGALEWQ
jgi:NADH-quinone oxidoreductase subunit A